MARILSSPVGAVQDGAYPLSGTSTDYDPLLDFIGDARFILIGEASHGTDEFYRQRAEITKRLIVERGVTAVAVEADWPDAYRINNYVRGRSDDPDADAALGNFLRFPTWMWRNEVVLEFVEWLRAYNNTVTDETRKVGFYGLDLYSLHASIDAVIRYLEDVDPKAAERARQRYGCFEYFESDVQAYGYAASSGVVEPCEEDVIEQLLELQASTASYLSSDGRLAEDLAFFAEQNARLVRNAEQYYRTMFRGSVSSWNLRDQHMAGTLNDLTAHLGQFGRPPRVAVWAHNSHLGDARATGMGASGELNLGQLVREQHGEDAKLIGFTTYDGTVTAASNWDGPAELKDVRPALRESYEATFHDAVAGRPEGNFLLILAGDGGPAQALDSPRLERAIGVIYRPQTERQSHYFTARLPQQFDAILHFDRTRALRPLDPVSTWSDRDLPETYPFRE